MPLHALLPWLHVGLLLCGSTGTGKSVFLKYLLSQLYLHLKSIHCFEMYKAELRGYLPLLQAQGIDLVIIRPQDACLNSLQPVGNPRDNAWIAVDNLCKHLGLPSRARSILYRAVMGCYRDWGLLDGNPASGGYPTWHHVFLRILADKKLNFQSREAILDRLGAYLESINGAYTLGWSPEDLAHYHCVFEYHNASESRKGIDTAYLLRSLLMLAVSRQVVNTAFSNLIVLDDAHRFLSNGNEADGGVTPMEELLAVIRGTGMGVFALVQSLSRLPIGVLANLGNRGMFRLGTDQDYRQLASDMNMTAAQREWAKRHLRPGLALFTLADGPWREPFLIKVPHYKLPSGVTDEQAKATLKCLAHLPVKRAAEFDDFSVIESVTIAGTTALETVSEAGNAVVTSSGPSTAIGSTPTDELRYLQAIHENTGLNASAFRKLLGIGSVKSVRLRMLLIQKGWVKETPVQKNAKGRSAKVLSLTPQGEEILREEGVLS